MSEPSQEHNARGTSPAVPPSSPPRPASTRASVSTTEHVTLFDSRSQIFLTNLNCTGSGPLPSAAALREYEQIAHGLPGRIADQFIAQGGHRRELEKKEADSGARRRDKGQTRAFWLALSGMAATTVLGVWGNPVLAGVVVIASVGGPAAAFVLARTVGRQAGDSSDA